MSRGTAVSRTLGTPSDCVSFKGEISGWRPPGVFGALETETDAPGRRDGVVCRRGGRLGAHGETGDRRGGASAGGCRRDEEHRMARHDQSCTSTSVPARRSGRPAIRAGYQRRGRPEGAVRHGPRLSAVNTRSASGTWTTAPRPSGRDRVPPGHARGGPKPSSGPLPSARGEPRQDVDRGERRHVWERPLADRILSRCPAPPHSQEPVCRTAGPATGKEAVTRDARRPGRPAEVAAAGRRA